MNRKKYRFFHGLDGAGVEDTIEAYTERSEWHVQQVNHNKDGFWILLVVEL